MTKHPAWPVYVGVIGSYDQTLLDGFQSHTEACHFIKNAPPQFTYQILSPDLRTRFWSDKEPLNYKLYDL
jgi:hypothetical protein